MRSMKSDSGFGLIGTMIAMVLLGIAVTALSSAGVYVVAIQTDSQVRSAATAIAASYLEQVKIREPSQVTSETPVTVDEDGLNDAAGPFARSLEVVDETGLENTRRVTVRVDYRTGRGRTKTIELVTILYEGVSN